MAPCGSGHHHGAGELLEKLKARLLHRCAWVLYHLAPPAYDPEPSHNPRTFYPRRTAPLSNYVAYETGEALRVLGVGLCEDMAK